MKHIELKGTPTTQKEAVLWHFDNYKEITSWEAIKEYGITRLAAIICDLRKEGYEIISTDVTRTNRFGNSVTIAKYTYIKPLPSHE